MPADEHEDVLNKVKAWAVPGLGGLVMLLLTIQGNSAIRRMDEVSDRMNQMITKYEVSNAQAAYLAERVKQLEESKKEAGTVHQQLDTRLNSLEQRAALYDQFMQTHK